MKCPLCSINNSRSFEIYTQEKPNKKKHHAIKCRHCELMYLIDYVKDRASIYDENYGIWGKNVGDIPMVAESKKEAFKWQLRYLLKYINPKNKKLLDIGTGNGYALDEAFQMGFDCYGLDISEYACKKANERFPNKIFNGTLEKAHYKDDQFDVIMMTDLIEHIPQPVSFLKEIDRILKRKGLIFIITPNSDSKTRKILGKNWFQYKYEHVTYWNKKSLKYLFDPINFQILELRTNIKKYRLRYYHNYFKKYVIIGISTFFLMVYKLLPPAIKNMYFSNPLTGEILVIAQKQ